MIAIAVVAHGGLAQSMFDTVKSIAGRDAAEVYAISVSCGTDCSLVDKQLKEIYASSSGGVLVLTDLFGGTASNIPALAAKNFDNVEIICGVNLGMFLSALHHRPGLPLAELALKVEADGKRSVINLKQLMRR